MQAIILAAGKGERMRPLTLTTPKPLLKVHGKPLIEYHIENLVSAGIKHIVINVSWLAEQIINTIGEGKKWNVRITYSIEKPEPLETGGGVLKAISQLDKNLNFIVVNGDVKTNFDFKTFKKSNSKLAHLVLVPNPEHHPDGDFSISENNLIHEDSKPKFTFSGIGIYSPQIFKNCKPGRFKLAPLLKKQMPNNLISGELFSGEWSDVGTIDRLNSLNPT